MTPFTRGALVVALSTFTSQLHAEPLVVGFERFHQQPNAEAGRLLFNELGCANCHASSTSLPQRRGPVLSGVTQRVRVEWLRHFIADPAKVKPGTNMPHLITEGPTAAADIDAIIHYLGSLSPKPAKPKGAKYLNSERGSDVFHTFGCVACHAPGKDYQPPAGTPKTSDYTHRSVPLPAMAEKYSLSSLTYFLSEPLKVRPDGRMPHIDMHDGDVSDLAAYLMDYNSSDGSTAPQIPGFKYDKALAVKGRDLVKALRCASCHDLPKDVMNEAASLVKTDSGCLAEKPLPGVAHYDLSKSQLSALRSFVGVQTGSKPFTPKLQADLTLEALNCLACHSRDGIGGPDAARKAYFTGDHNLGDTGLYPPPLTDAGRKFQPDWLKNVISGKTRVRPYLQTQMPHFGKAVEELSGLLAKADALDTTHEKRESGNVSADPVAGQKLLGTNGGNGCITCHRWDKRPSMGIQALDISTLGVRLQPEWLHEYLINPAAHRPGTLMPSFWPGGQSMNKAILEGDTDKQIASIIAFAKLGKGEPEGYPSNLAGEFELLPKDHPIVQRTFMQGVGTHAILVGFPAGIHIAYDGLNARPAMAWKGKFFDAYNTWFTRAAPFEKPLGDNVVSWSAPSSAVPGNVNFRGFKLDAARVPTFLYDIGKDRVQERFEPKDGKLVRTLTWDALAMPDIDISHPEGLTFIEAPGSKAGQRTYIYSWK